MGLLIFIAADLIAIAGFILFYQIRKKAEQKRSRERMAFLRLKCMECGYSLNGLPKEVSTCPECGANLPF
jgi:rubrerythrin